MPTPDDIVAQMRDALALAEPELDTSIGSPTRKIIDAVAVAIAPAYADQHLQNYSWDINAKSGSDLDDFVAMFGFTRFPARRATGTVAFSRGTASPDSRVDIGINTQIATADGVVFQSVVNAVLFPGQTSADVPVQAVLGGVSGNVGANTVTYFATQLSGVTAVTNADSMTGGTEAEDDASLRDRFQKTVFRSMAGTESMYYATALEAGSTPDIGPVVTAVNVIGSSKRWREQVMFVLSGANHVATSAVPTNNVKYVYDKTEAFGTDIDAGLLFTPDTDYTFAPSIPPSVTAVWTGIDYTQVYDLDFEYVPAASRNDPSNNITNRIDVWVAGTQATAASEVVRFPATTSQFTATAGQPLTASKFVREDTANTPPTVGNYFVPLTYGPILTFPTTIVINGVTYTKGTDFWVVHDDTAFGYGPTSLYGLEWLAARAPATGAGTLIALTDNQSYTYNDLPWRVERSVRDWRMVATDARAHAAKVRRLLLNVAVMFSPHYDRGTIIDAIKARVGTFLDARGFDAAIQVSDLLAEIHAVNGVDAVRFLRQDENTTNYAVQWVTSAGAVISTFADAGGRANDVLLGDDTVAALHDINVTVKTQNTWGSN